MIGAMWIAGVCLRATGRVLTACGAALDDVGRHVETRVLRDVHEARIMLDELRDEGRVREIDDVELRGMTPGGPEFVETPA